MSRKILSFMLIFCLFMGIMPGTNVYATEDGADIEEALITSIQAGDQSVYEGDEIEIPQNGSEVYMEDMSAAQPAMFRLPREDEPKAANKRYTVLLLDISGTVTFNDVKGSALYTADTAFPYVHASSKKFIEAIGAAPGENYVAIAAFNGGESQVVSPFTDDVNALLKAMDSLYITGSSGNVHSGLTTAEELIDSVSDQSGIKNVVLFTTGMTKEGSYSYMGPYNTLTVGGRWYNSGTNIPLYAYANAAYAAAEELKSKCTVYSIGLFQAMENMPEEGRDIAQFFKMCACDWASSKNHFYDIKDPTYLEFVFGQVAGNITKCTGTFCYPGKGEDYSATYYYDDNYFKESSYEYNQSLATMSLCLDLSAWESEETSDYTRKMKNAEELLNELGFVGFDHNYTDFAEEGITGKPTKDSVGVVAANKLLSFDGKDYTLIAVAVRGGGYEREWASNFTMGESGDHEGFSKARDIVIGFLKEYLKEQRISGDIKLWITGYSRAAATANMVAGTIDQGVISWDDCNLELKDMFAYTFETPAGVVDPEARSAKYGNIFNIINRNDVVPYVAPQDWKFTRYGIDECLPSPERDEVDTYEEKKRAMLWMYWPMEGYEGYEVDYLERIVLPNPLDALHTPLRLYQTKKDVSQEVFLREFVSLLAREYLKDRQNYVATYQSGVRDSCGAFFGTKWTKKAKLYVNVEAELKKRCVDIICQSAQGDKAGLCQTIGEALEEGFKASGITDYNEEEFAESMGTLVNLLADIALNDSYRFITLAINLDTIGQAHYPELCLAWMQSMDTNYTTDAKLGFAPGKYRIVRVNCPVDVRVYDAEGRELAAIIDDTPQPDSHVVVSFNSEGEKVVYLPVYNDYAIRLTATGDGYMNYAIHEYDAYAGETNHAVFFNDIEITAGQEYMAYLPSLTEEEIESMTGKAADTDYTVFLGEEQILCSEELKDEEVFDAYYQTRAFTEDTGMGLVFGSGLRQYGTFAMVTAAAYEGYEFVGWYEGGHIDPEHFVSAEEEYRFRVSEDVELRAVFQEGSPEETPDKKLEEGTSDGSDDTNEGKGDTGDNGSKGTITGAFELVSRWETGFNARITLTNTTDEVVHDWVVAFDLPYEIESIWNGVIRSHENGVYTVENAGYNWDIQPGASVSFGFYTREESAIGTITEPTYYTLIQRPAQTAEQKFEIDYKVNSDWGTGLTGQLEIRNLSSEEIYDWTLEFDSDYHFEQFWNAEIVSHQGNHYVIKNKSYNAVIGAGQTLGLGFMASHGSTDPDHEPIHYRLSMVNRNSIR